MAAPKEETFSSYNKQQGQEYGRVRPDYHPDVYATILGKHTSTGGKLDTVLDVGCGPGLATKKLAAQFQHAIGLDPSTGMIENARGAGLQTKNNELVRFEVSTAEDLGQSLSPSIAAASVDLVTAANAAHWFDMPGFWKAAARVLKPGGTVALWTSGDIRAHPETTAAAELDALIDRWDEKLAPYFTHGNILTKGGYRQLPLPWSSGASVPGFDAEHFERIDWSPTKPFFTGPDTLNLDMFEKVRGTSSFVTRWRQAHPDLVGTEKDCLRELRREMEVVLHNAGVQPGKEKLKGAVYGVILIIKKI